MSCVFDAHVIHISANAIEFALTAFIFDNGEANHNLTDVASIQRQLDMLRAHSDLVNSKRECLFHPSMHLVLHVFFLILVCLCHWASELEQSKPRTQ